MLIKKIIFLIVILVIISLLFTKNEHFDNSDNLSTNTFNSEEDREINKLLEEIN